MLLLAPVAGAVVDRLPRVRVMVAADLWRAALAGVLPLVDHRPAAVYAIAFALSAGAVFFNPASASVLPGVVDEGELVAASSMTGVKRHCLGCMGKVANRITTVHLADVREWTGHALIGAWQWILAEHLFVYGFADLAQVTGALRGTNSHAA